MRSVAAMEWLLARYAGRQRAAAMLGDLLEQRGEKGEWWFWRSATGVLLSVAWRPVLGFVAALFVWIFSLRALRYLTFGVHMEHRPERLWTHALINVAAVGAMMWFVFVYAGARYGLNDRVTRMALGIAALATAIIFGWWQPIVLAGCIIVSAGLIVASLVSRSYRGAFLAVFAVTVAGFVASWGIQYLIHAYQHLLRVSVGDRKLREHLFVTSIVFPLLVWGWILAPICAGMHRWLLEPKVQTEIAD